MTQEERAATMKLLAATRKMFPQSKADGDTFALYIAALDDLTFPEIQAGVMKCLRTAKFFPTVAEIYDAAESMQQHADGTGKPDAGAAWKEAIDFAKSRGPYDDRPFPWSCPEVAEAVDRFGRTSLWELESRNESTARAQFRDIYEKILRTEKDKKVMKAVGKRLGGAYARLTEGVGMKKIEEGA